MIVWLFQRLSHLPLSVLYVLADGLAWVLVHLLHYRRSVVIRNLSTSFPEKPPAEIKKLTRAFYYNLSDVLVETLKGLSISAEELQKRVVFRNLATIHTAYDQQQSVILLTTHQCNWEWLLLAGCLALPHPVDAVYKTLNDPAFDRLMLSARSRFGGQPIVRNRVLRELLRRKGQTRAIALVADQTFSGGTERYWIDFLHQKTAFYRAIEQLPKAVNYPVLFVRMKRLRRGYYEATFVPLGHPPYAEASLTILPRYVEETERMIREQPANWLWSHQRWKHPYPDTNQNA